MRNGHAQLWLRRVDAADAHARGWKRGRLQSILVARQPLRARFLLFGQIEEGGYFGQLNHRYLSIRRIRHGRCVVEARGDNIRKISEKHCEKVSDKGGAPESIAGTELSSDGHRPDMANLSS